MSAGTNHSIHRGNSRALRTVNHHPSLLQRVLACNKLVLSTSIVQLFAHAPCRQMKCGSKPDATALLVFSTSTLQAKLLCILLSGSNVFLLQQAVTRACCAARPGLLPALLGMCAASKGFIDILVCLLVCYCRPGVSGLQRDSFLPEASVAQHCMNFCSCKQYHQQAHSRAAVVCYIY